MCSLYTKLFSHYKEDTRKSRKPRRKEYRKADQKHLDDERSLLTLQLKQFRLWAKHSRKAASIRPTTLHLQHIQKAIKSTSPDMTKTSHALWKVHLLIYNITSNKESLKSSQGSNSLGDNYSNRDHAVRLLIYFEREDQFQHHKTVAPELLK